MGLTWKSGVMVAAMGATCVWASEPPRVCFRSIAEAAQQTHLVDPENVGPAEAASGGFRLQEVRRDRMLDRRWAIVRSCGHPEQPAVSVPVGAESGLQPVLVSVSGRLEAPAYVPPVVRAGQVVRLVGTDGNLRFEVTGIAQMNGAMGQRIPVRLVRGTTNDDGTARVLTGTVRSAELVEWER